MSLGHLFSSLNEFVKEKKCYEEAIEIVKELGGERRLEGKCYSHLGTVFGCLGEYNMAENYFQKALELSKEVGEIRDTAALHANLGSVFNHLKRYTEAEEHLHKAIEIAKEIGDRGGQARCYRNLAGLKQQQGEYVKAREFCNKGLVLSREIGDSEAELVLLGILAEIAILEGNTKEGVRHLHATIHKCETVQGFLSGKEEIQMSFADQQLVWYRSLSAGLFNDKPIEALYLMELSRARALANSMSARNTTGEKKLLDPQSIVNVVMGLEIHSSCLYLSFSGCRLFWWILKSNKQILSGTITTTDCFKTEAALEDLDDFFGKEPFRKFHLLPKKQCEDRSLNALNASHAEEQSQENNQTVLRLIEEEEEDEEEDRKLHPSLAVYYQLIIAPVAHLLDDESEIIIVPDRSMYKLPFSALENENGRFLSEKFRIRIVPSLTTLRLIQERPIDNQTENALILGDPDVSEVLLLNQLSYARKEAEMIGRLLGAHPLLGYEATKVAVLEMMHSASLVHFAAHGDAERGEIALAPVRPVRREIRAEDYMLTMSEISEVLLRAKLVVLSSCHSGRGKIRAEGVVGIARAFLKSGARSVLVSLWAIEDDATEQFMIQFYEHLVRGESASECLHEAMKWMRANGFSEVRQWAPFMLIGNDVTFDVRT